MLGLPAVPSELTALDAEDKSKSVAEARHMVRKTMLLPALDKIFEIGMDPGNKPSDRYNALKFIVDFGAEAQGSGEKQISRLSPEAARLIAKFGLVSGHNEDQGAEASVPSAVATKERGEHSKEK